MSGAIIKAKLDVKGQMGLRTQHVRGQAASAKACAERAWTAKYAFAQHTRSSDVGRGMPSSPLGSTHGRTTSGVACMPSSPLGSTHGRTASGVACHLRLFAAHTVERRRAWHAIIALGQHKRSAVVGRACTQRSAVACPHRSWLAQHSSSSKQNMRMFMAYINQRILKQPPCITNIFIYFPLSILKRFRLTWLFRIIFVTFTVRTILKHLLFVQICILSLI